MNILLTNDDGIAGHALHELKSILSDDHVCTVVAPDAQRSASAHAVSINKEIHVQKHYCNDNYFGYSVEGTPVDCVKIALTELLEKPPDIIIAGINRGANTGVSVFYSGTVAAAREGAIAGIPSVAVSLCSASYTDFSYACVFIQHLAKIIERHGIKQGAMLNVNIPPLPKEDIKGIKVTKQAHSRFIEKYVCKQKENGILAYTLTGRLEVLDTNNNNDEYAVLNGYVSITPLALDLTAVSYGDELQKTYKPFLEG